MACGAPSGVVQADSLLFERHYGKDLIRAGGPEVKGAGMITLGGAILPASQAHTGQTDKTGEPYILHPLRLMMKMDTEKERMAAVLHDILEDTSHTAQELRSMGYPEEVISAVEHLARGWDESYNDLVLRVKTIHLPGR